MTNEPLPPATCALGAEALPADPVDIPAASSPSQAHTHSYGQGLLVKRSRVPARETRSRTIARFNGGPSGDLQDRSDRATHRLVTEWRLLMATHNLTKLHRRQIAAIGA